MNLYFLIFKNEHWPNIFRPIPKLVFLKDAKLVEILIYGLNYTNVAKTPTLRRGFWMDKFVTLVCLFYPV